MQQLPQPQMFPELAYQVAPRLRLRLRLVGDPSGLYPRPLLAGPLASFPFSVTMALGLALGVTRDRTSGMLFHRTVSPLRLGCGNLSLADSAVFVNVKGLR